MPKADKQLTEQRQFVENRSYVCKDGREVLVGLDWQRRLQQLRNRCGGRCEYRIPNSSLMEGGEDMRCARPAQDPHHIILRSHGRDDRMSNLMAVCRHHHQILDVAQRKERVKR